MAKKAMTIVIDREEDALTISVAPPKGRGLTFYETFCGKISKGTADLVIQTEINWRVNGECPDTPIFLDKRLVDVLPVITNSPFKGEFKLVYTDEGGLPISEEPQITTPETVDTTPRHVRIVMYGDQTAMFEVFVNDELSNYKIFGKSPIRKKDIDAWLIGLYRNRRRYPNLTIEIPRVVACWLDSLSCTPRIIDGLHMTLTETPPNYNVQDLYATA